MENQHNKKCDQLSILRDKIDKIDNEIIDLLGARMKIIAEVADYKKSNNEKFFIRSAREADMIKNLIAKADKTIPASTIISIWRKIISSANIAEQDLKVVIHNPNKISDYTYIAREYYGDFVPLVTHDSITNIISEIEKNSAQIAIFALPNEQTDQFQNSIENWWINLAGNSKNIRIFARIPFADSENNDDNKNGKTVLVAAAIKDAEKSANDKTLLMVEIAREVSKGQIQNALKEVGISGLILKTASLKQVEGIIFYLIEADGFFEINSPEIVALSKSKAKPFIKIIGSYPTPVKI